MTAEIAHIFMTTDGFIPQIHEEAGGSMHFVSYESEDDMIAGLDAFNTYGHADFFGIVDSDIPPIFPKDCTW